MKKHHLCIAAGLLVFGAGAWFFHRSQERREATFVAGAPTWPKVPLGVWHGEPALQPYASTFAAAMDTINSRVGCQVLERVDVKEQAQVILRTYDGMSRCDGRLVPEMPGALALTQRCATSVDTQFKRLDDVRVVYRIALHEFGHAFGLEHDETGAMAPAVTEPRPGDPPEHLLLSNADAKALRERYCR